MSQAKIFIQHPFSSVNGHMITAQKLISDFETEANIGCGQYYEIFEARVLSKVSHASHQMDDKTRDTFLSYAKSKGYDLIEQEKADAEYMEILREQQGDMDEIPF